MFGDQLIILDYDDTYTTKPALWDVFIKAAITQGCRVVCCTLRHYRGDNSDIQRDLTIPVVYAAEHDSKREAMEAMGYETDGAIWIDDYPEGIGKAKPNEDYAKHY